MFATYDQYEPNATEKKVNGKTRKKFRLAMDNFKYQNCRVPMHTRDGLELYFFDQCEPGGFLTAVLENNLSGAVCKADLDNLKNLPGIVAFLYNHCPSRGFGSPARVEDWLNPREIERD